MALLPDIICLQLEANRCALEIKSSAWSDAGDYRSQSPTVAQQLP